MLKFCFEHIAAKTATMDPHPILNHGNIEQFKEFLKTAFQAGTDVFTKMYWFFLDIIVMKGDIPIMMDRVWKTPIELDIANPDNTTRTKNLRIGTLTI